MRLPDARIVTALVVIAGCLFALWRGAGIVAFGAAQTFAKPDARAKAAQPWTATPGIASIALGVSIVSTAVPLDVDLAAERRARLMDVLSLRPLASPYWLSLAGMEFAAGRAERIAPALSLSALTGPNEGPVMAHRALFGVALWETLPADVRRHVINDLAGARLGDREINQFKLIMAGKKEQTRDAIRDALLQTGRLSARLLAAYGIDAEQPSGTVRQK